MSIILFLAILVALIVVHELGHFIVAKCSGVRVDEFGIFFPPKLFGKKIGETEYTINLWPIGGFVKIFGENPDKESLEGEDRDRALTNKPKLVQAAVLVGGVAFNVLAAWVLFSAAFMIGIPASPESDTARPIQDPVLTIIEVLPNSPAAEAGIMPGDKVEVLVSEDDILRAPSAETAVEFIDEHNESKIEITYRRGKSEGVVEVLPQAGVIEGEPARRVLGVSMGLVGTLSLPAHLAIWEGLKLTLSILAAVTVGIVSFFVSALTLSADLSQVAGPVGIVNFVGDAAALGLVSLISFTAFISLNLAVINLLPIPALDGGRLLFVLIETVKGSPINPKTSSLLNMLGFALLIILMLLVTYSDIARLFAG